MKDTHKIVIQAFLIALYQQEESLSDQTQQQINYIAQSLETSIPELDNLATSDSTLSRAYGQAYAQLSSDAGERRMGVEAIPKYDPKDDIYYDTDNMSRDTSKVQQILSSRNSVKAMKQEIEKRK